MKTTKLRLFFCGLGWHCPIVSWRTAFSVGGWCIYCNEPFQLDNMHETEW